MTSNSLLYLSGGIISAVFPYLILAYMARNLPIEQLGYLALFQTLILTVTSFVNLNTSSAIERFHYENSDDSSQYVLISLITATVVSILLAGAILVSPNSIPNFLELRLEHVILAVILGYFCYIYNLRHMLYQINFQTERYVTVQLLYSIIPFALFFCFVVFCQNDFTSRILSLIFSYSIFATLSLISIYKITSNSNKSLKTETVKKVLIYSYPLLLNTFISIANLTVLRFLVNYYTNITTTGIFLAIFQLSMLASFIVDAINRAYSPYAIKILTSNIAADLKQLITIKKILILIAILSVFLAYIVSEPLVEIVLGAKFKDNKHTLFLLLLGHIFHGLSYLYLPTILVRNQTHFVTISNLFSFLILTLSMYVLSTDLTVILIAKVFAFHKLTHLIFIISFSISRKK